MDSLTQIVLGAACGELALGKKIGNKAMFFGAIGGTIPDLDVFIGSWIYGHEIDAMAFHRGFMHSFVFAILAPFFFGWITHKLYNTGKRKETTTLQNWILLYFISIFTHPILDSFTPYGTQLFSPFFDYRVAFNNISVADPMYTIPFLICLIIALFFNRKRTRRRTWVKLGIYFSSAYMFFTIGNKIYMDSVFKNIFEEAGISYSRYRTQPTILNNILWYGIAETKTDFKIAYYSLFDKKSTVNHIFSIPKNVSLLPMKDSDLANLTWFSDDYYFIEKTENPTRIIYNDLRYVMATKDSIKAVMNFEIIKNGPRFDMRSIKDFNPPKGFLSRFWNRIKGI